MRRSLLRREFESGDGALVKGLRLLVLAGGLCFLVTAAILGLTWPQQMLLGLFTVLIAGYLNRRSSSYLITLTLILISMFSTLRYGYWRMVTAKQFFATRGAAWSAIDAVFVVLLFGAECYSFLVLFVGYLQTLWPLRRAPVPLPDDPEDWPAVDLLIATYNESLSLVRYTVLAAMNIDWPADKLNIYLLDDGRREEFQLFAEDAGIGYMTRANNRNAKAGNTLADVVLPDGTVAFGVTADVSSSGALVNLNEASSARAGACVSFVFQVLDGVATLPATISVARRYQHHDSLCVDGCTAAHHARPSGAGSSAGILKPQRGNGV